MRRLYYCLFFSILFSFSVATELIDLEEMKQDFVVETKKIEIPGYPYAFNPSMIRLEEDILMCFRVIPDRKSSFTSKLGLVWLDKNFNPKSRPQFLDLRQQYPSIPCRAEDGRLIMIGERLYIVYADNIDQKITAGGFRVFIAEILYDGKQFKVKDPTPLLDFDEQIHTRREKNWSPFEYQGKLLLSYSQVPHRVFYPIPEKKCCETVALTNSTISWKWGELRGGTPALVHEGEYLSFFHSSIDMPSLHSEGKKISHYFMGAYTFSLSPPFSITKMSSSPIIGPGFYHGSIYQPYWKQVRVVFPGGYIFDDDYIWISYGRQDHEVWVAKLDKREFLKTLVPVN